MYSKELLYSSSHVGNVTYSRDTRDCSATVVKDVDFFRLVFTVIHNFIYPLGEVE